MFLRRHRRHTISEKKKQNHVHSAEELSTMSGNRSKRSILIGNTQPSRCTVEIRAKFEVELKDQTDR